MSLAPPADPIRPSTGANRDYRLLLMYSTSSDESVHSACRAELPRPNTTKCGREYSRSWARARVRTSGRETRWSRPNGGACKRGDPRETEGNRAAGPKQTRVGSAPEKHAATGTLALGADAAKRARWFVCLFVCLFVRVFGAARACGRHESSLWLSASRRSRQSDPRSCGAAFMRVHACVVFPFRAAGRTTPNSLHPFHAALQCWAFVASRVAKTCLRQRFQQVRRQVEPRQVLE